MKTLAALLFAFLLPCLCLGQPSLRLIGVVDIFDRPAAVLELSDSRPTFGRQSATKILSEHERDGELEVMVVDLAQATVQARYLGSNYSLAMPAGENTKGYTVRLADVPLSAVLKLYAELTGQTLLQHPELTEEKFSFTSVISNRSALAAVFADALTNAGMVSIPDGDKFLRILPTALAKKIQLIQIPMRGTNEAQPSEKLPAGAIDFIAAKFEQAAKIQAELIHRKLEPYRSTRLTKDIVLKTQQPLSRAEIVYALDVQFAWRDMKMVAVDHEFAKVVPLSDP